MSDYPEKDHLPPDVFVDVCEGAPIDAFWRRHLDGCESCRQEAAGLVEALALLRRSDVADADADAEADPERVTLERPPELTPPAPVRSKSYALAWVASAAAVLAVSFSALWLAIGRGPALPEGAESDAAVIDALLPPAELDEEFQLLLTLSDDGSEEELVIEGAALATALPDPTPLTRIEQQRLLQRLADEMRNRS